MEPPSDASGQSVLERIKAVEDEIRQSRWVEIAVVLDPVTGQELWRKRGAGDTVDFSLLERAAMDSCVVTHNHPVGWQYPPGNPRRAGTSFSREDLELATLADVAELRAVTPLLRFSLERPDAGWPDSTAFLADHEAIEWQVERMLLREIGNGTLTQEFADAEFPHMVMVRLASKYRLHYFREVG